MVEAERERLERLYEELGSVSAVARHQDVPVPTMHKRFRRLGIAIRRRGFRSPKATFPTGADHHLWRGGTFISSRGYIYEYAPRHPAAARGYVFQHRLVIEKALGRYLRRDELVHHVNEDRTDNRLENLRVMSQKEHSDIHRALRKRRARRDERGRFAKRS